MSCCFPSVGFTRVLSNSNSQTLKSSVTYDPEARQRHAVCLNTMFDAAGALFDQYFQSTDDADLPRIWEELDFEGRKIYVQYHTENSDLKSQADRLLGKDSDEALDAR